jgi:hypothetical protein
MARRARRAGEQLQHRQCKTRGLAGAGLCGAKQVAATQYERNRLRLDWGGLGIALLGNRAQQLRAQAEAVERSSNDNLLKIGPGSSASNRFRQKLFFRQGDSQPGKDCKTTGTLTGRCAAETYKRILASIALPRLETAR